MNFLGVGNIVSQKPLHVFWIGRFEGRDERRTVERFDIEMTGHSENSDRFVRGSRSDLGDVARRAVDSNRGHSAEMLNIFPRQTDRPAKFLVRNHSEMSEVPA